MIAAYGVTATSAAFGGAAKPTDEMVQSLRGADVVLVADRDKTGKTWAENWLGELLGVARSVRLVARATLGEKDDAVEHIEAGYGLACAWLSSPSYAPRFCSPWLLGEALRQRRQVGDA